MKSFLADHQKEHCVNCDACVQICPVQAISIHKDFLEFGYPSIDEAKCIHCNKCQKVCFFTDHNIRFPQNDPVAYAAWNNDELVRLSSSSGGVFGALAMTILKRNGSVYGAVYDDIFNVKHIRIDSVEDLNPLFGSKYIQSDIHGIYSSIETDLKSRPILFCGTPCQIAGLYSFLGNKEYPGLYTCDLICHGVLSKPALDYQIKEIEDEVGDQIVKINLRDKKRGQGLLIHIITKMQCERWYEMKQTSFYDLFNHNYYLRDSCFSCEFSSTKRISDVTLGDFWGIEKKHPGLKDPRGVSFILVNTNKGNSLLQCSEVQYESVMISDSDQPNLYHPTNPDIWHKSFLKEAKKKGIEYAIKHYTAPRPIWKKILRFIQRKFQFV